MNTYFAVDGAYGDADGIVVVDCSQLTEEDWDTIDAMPDNMRGITAIELVINARERK